MDKNLQAFEDLLRKTLQKSEVSPSPEVLRKLRFRLWASEFFGLNLRKMNILYTGIIIGGIAGAIILSKNKAAEESYLTSDKADQETFIKAEVDKQIEAPAEKSAGIDHPKSAEVMLVAEFEAEAIRGCAPLEVNFKNRSAHATSYSWDFGTGDRSYKKNPSYTYQEAGSYSAVLTVRDEAGNKAFFRKRIEVLKSPVAEFKISIDQSNIETREIVFNNRSEGASAYTWDFGDQKKSHA